MKRHRIFGMKIANLLLKSDVLAPFQPSKDEKRIILQTEGKKYLRLNLKSRQLCSLKGLRGDTIQKDGSVAYLDASFNRISDMTGVESLAELRFLNLSLNQISCVSGLSKLSCLHTLNISKNHVTDMVWCKDLPLVNLDISLNNITSLCDVGGIKTLEVLNAKGNFIESLDGIQGLNRLTSLFMQRNKLRDIDCILSLSQIKQLSIANNQVTDISKLAKVIFAMTSLEDLNCSGNPVQKLDNYKFRILQNTSIKVLDHAKIRAHLRDRINELESKKQLNQLVEETTSEYTARIHRERSILDQGLNVYHARQQMVMNAFTQFKQQMETELEDCVSYAEALSSHHRESLLLSTDGLDAWKDQIKMAVQERMEEDRQRQAVEKKMKADRVSELSSRLSFHQKLQELSLKRPEVWRAMKQKELDHADAEEAALRIITEEKRQRIDATNKQLESERVQRAKLTMKLAKEMNLESIPEWAGAVKTLNNAVKEEKSLDVAAAIIQRKFRSLLGSQAKALPCSLNQEDPIDESDEGPLKANDVNAKNQKAKKRGWSIFKKKKPVNPSDA